MWRRCSTRECGDWWRDGRENESLRAKRRRRGRLTFRIIHTHTFRSIFSKLNECVKMRREGDELPYGRTLRVIKIDSLGSLGDIRESKNPRIPEPENQRGQESKNLRIRKFQNPRIREPKNPRIRKSENSKIRESENQRIHEIREFQNPRIWESVSKQLQNRIELSAVRFKTGTV